VAQEGKTRQTSVVQVSSTQCVFAFDQQINARPVVSMVIVKLIHFNFYKWSPANGAFSQVKFISTLAYISMPMGCMIPFPGEEGDMTTDFTIFLNRIGDLDLNANTDKIQYAIVTNTSGNWTVVGNRMDNVNSYDMNQRE